VDFPVFLGILVLMQEVLIQYTIPNMLMCLLFHCLQEQRHQADMMIRLGLTFSSLLYKCHFLLPSGHRDISICHTGSKYAALVWDKMFFPLVPVKSHLFPLILMAA
jgi:hypothetical protein